MLTTRRTVWPVSRLNKGKTEHIDKVHIFLHGWYGSVNARYGFLDHEVQNIDPSPYIRSAGEYGDAGGV
jgi:hypothetical protein